MNDWLSTATDFIKNEEGCRLNAYPDPATGGAPWTIGYGATGPDIKAGTYWSQQRAENDLRAQIIDIGEDIDLLVKVPLTANQRAALASLIYNIGRTAFQGSTLLKSLNQKDYIGAAHQFSVWNRAANKINAGLINRRAREVLLFQRR